MGCQRCQEAVARSAGSPELVGDWTPLARTGLPLGSWIATSTAPGGFVCCQACGARWVAQWDPRELFWSFDELPAAAECLLRADTAVTDALRATDRHPTLRWLLARYLREARYDGREALSAILERVAGAAYCDGCRDWLFSLEALLGGSQGAAAAAALADSLPALTALRWRPDWRETDPARSPSWRSFRAAFARVATAALSHAPPGARASLQALAAAADDWTDALATLRQFARGETTAERAVAEFGALDQDVRADGTGWSDEELAMLFTAMERLAGVHVGRHAAETLRAMFTRRLRAGALSAGLATRAIAALEPDLARLHRPAQFCPPERVPAGCGRCRAGAPERPSATPYGDTALGGAYWVPRAPGNGVLVCGACASIRWRRRDPQSGQVEASVMPRTAQALVKSDLTVEGLFSFLASPEYPAVRTAGGLMLAWHYFETEYWLPSEDTAALFTAAFARPDPCFDVTCDRLELLRLAVAMCAREGGEGDGWPFPFDLRALAARILGEPPWLTSVLPSNRAAARAFALELLRRIRDVGGEPLGFAGDSLAGLPVTT